MPVTQAGLPTAVPLRPLVETSATALGRIGDPRAIDPLVAALRDAYPEVREAAAGALGEIGGAAVGPLIAVFDDPGSRAEERVWAARSLVEMYQSGRLGEAARLDILRRRQEIEHTHYDVHGGASCTKPSKPRNGMVETYALRLNSAS